VCKFGAVAGAPGFPYLRTGPTAVAAPAEKRGSPATPTSTTGAFKPALAASLFLEAFNVATAPPPTTAPRAKKAARTRDEAGMGPRETEEYMRGAYPAEGHLYSTHYPTHYPKTQGPGKSQLPMHVKRQVFYISTRSGEGRVKEITSSCAAGKWGRASKKKEPSLET